MKGFPSTIQVKWSHLGVENYHQVEYAETTEIELNRPTVDISSPGDPWRTCAPGPMFELRIKGRLAAEPVVIKSPARATVTKEDIDAIVAASSIKNDKMGAKTTVVHFTMPNGFEIVESSSCVDPKNYDHNLGHKICMERIVQKLWLLEGYRLQCKLGESK